jgi:hypothetical protein
MQDAFIGEDRQHPERPRGSIGHVLTRLNVHKFPQMDEIDAFAGIVWLAHPSFSGPVIENYPVYPFIRETVSRIWVRQLHA